MPEPSKTEKLSKLFEAFNNLDADSNVDAKQFENVALAYLQFRAMNDAPDILTGLGIFATRLEMSAANARQLIAVTAPKPTQ